MPILLMLNLKGGVAKTTNCVAIAECLATQGKRVLVIDADHQCAASELLIGEERLNSCEGHGRTLHDLMGSMLKPDFVQRHVPSYIVDSVSKIGGGIPRLDLIPGSMRIDDFQSRIQACERDYGSSEYKKFAQYGKGQIRRHLFQNYDYTFIDCPPSVPAQVKLLLQLADGFIVPCVPDRLSVRGAEWLLERLDKGGYTRAKPVGILWSLFRKQMGMHCDYIGRGLKGEAPMDRLPPFRIPIPHASAMAQCADPDFHPATFFAKYTPEFAHRYRILCRELVRRTEGLGR
jgi:chromosome partitioning protein